MTIPAKGLLRDVERFAHDIRLWLESGYTIESIYNDETTVYVNFVNNKGKREWVSFSAWDD